MSVIYVLLMSSKALFWNIMHLKGNFKTEMQCANTPHTYMSIRGLRWVNCLASSTYGFNIDVIP